MAEYIKRIDAMKICQQHSKQCFNSNDAKGQFIAETIEDEIIEIPTVDVTVVRHGKWIGKYNTIQYNDWMCSYCGKYESETRNKDRLGNYCRWCGAKMDLE